MLYTTLSSSGLLEFNRRRWKLVPRQIRLTEPNSDLPAIEAVYYLDEHGRIRTPPLFWYFPVAFFPTPTNSPGRLGRQWLTLAGLLAKDMKQMTLRTPVTLPWNITDVRPWQWAGFKTSVSYTYLLNLPLDEKKLDPAVRNKTSQAEKMGVVCRRADSMEDVITCLRETERRQEFSYSVSLEDLRLAEELMGADNFRAYACYTKDNIPISARIVLYGEGGTALDWVAGTQTDYVTSGATQGLIRFILNDLHRVQARQFDFGGANIASVAAAKASWGGQLTPCHVIEATGIRGMLVREYQAWSYRRQRARR